MEQKDKRKLIRLMSGCFDYSKVTDYELDLWMDAVEIYSLVEAARFVALSQNKSIDMKGLLDVVEMYEKKVKSICEDLERLNGH